MLIKLWYNIENTIKGGEVTLAIFKDYSKAFDTIDFDIMLSKTCKLDFSTDTCSLGHLFIFSYSYNWRHLILFYIHHLRCLTNQSLSPYYLNLGCWYVRYYQ